MNKGFVTLVGAGCGKELITVKGLRALKEADVIIYDELLDAELLSQAREDAQKLYVGKRAGRHSAAQEEINTLLIANAKQGKSVVRLKGGDSFVFGRGGEEITALQKENIPYAVIPGVTSAVAVPGEFGIPVTHRGTSQSFTVVTGHTAGNTDEDYFALARLHGTLVFLMGLGNIKDICTRLIENGKDASTPAAILSRGFSENGKRINGTLGDIYTKAKEAEAPAILVIGDTAALDFSERFRFSVTVTGTKAFAGSLGDKLGNIGALVKIWETVKIIPYEENIPEDFADYGWLLFTSSNGVRIFFDTLYKRKIDLRALMHLKFACIGPKTAQLLCQYGFSADFIPSEYTAECLGRELQTDSKVLILRAENGSAALTKGFSQRNISFDDISIYNSAKNRLDNADCDTDYIVFASASGVNSFFEQGGQINRAKPVCIGNETALSLKKYTAKAFLTAKKHDGDGIKEAILEDIQ